MTLGVLIIAVAVTVALTYALYRGAQDHAEMDARVNLQAAQLSRYEDAQIAFGSLGSDLANYYATRDSSYADAFMLARLQVTRSLKDAREAAPALSNAEVARADALISTSATVGGPQDRVLRAFEQNDIEGALAIAREPGRVEASSKFVQQMKQAMTDGRGDLAAAQRGDATEQKQLVGMSVGIAGLWVALVLFLGAASFRWVVRPLEEVSLSILTIARGDLTVRVPESGPRELAQVGADVNTMAEALVRHSDEINTYLSRNLEARTKELEQANSALTASESRFRPLVQNAMDMITVIDATTLVMYQSPSSAEVLGRNPASMEGSPLGQLIHPDDLAPFLASIGEGTATAGMQVKIRMQHADGSWRTIEVRGSNLLDDPNVAGYVLNARDVTDETARTRALAERERMLLTLIHEAPVPLAALDLDGRVQLWNQAAERAFGWSEQDVIGQPYPLVPKGKEEEFGGLFRDVAVNGKPMVAVELHRQRKDGSPVDIAISTAPLRGDGGIAGGLMAVLVDITEAKRAEEALLESAAKYRSMFENAQDVFYQTTPQGAVVEVSPSVRRFGYSREQLIGTSVLDLYADAEERIAFVKALAERGEVTDYEIRLKRGDGGVGVASLSAHVRRDAAGEIIGFEGSLRDVSERKRLEAQLMQLADHDPLTGLMNRRRFDEELERHVSEAQRYGLQGVLLFIDLDGFKDVNDSRGHHAGDELLCALTRVLRERLRASDVAARLGGDEFAILLPHTDAEQARAVAADLLDAIRNRTFVVGGSPMRITASIGMAVFPDQAISSGEFLSRADLAMYRAKDEGRDRVCLFTPDGDWQAQIESRMGWHQRIRDALENDRFVLHAQPIMDLAEGRISRYELLLRLDSGDGEFVLPDVFLDTAERSGLIQDIDRWVVRRAIDLLAEHRAVGRELRLEVNLSGKAFADSELLEIIQEKLTATGVDPASLVLEVTETAAIASIDEAQKFIRTLKALGCGFALDDFGVGFSSFSHLKDLPVDYLKIDGSFIRDLAHNTVDQHLVQAIVGVARGLGKRTIAEFVGDGETLRLLRGFGVDFAQGYFIGRPAPLPSLADDGRRAA